MFDRTIAVFRYAHPVDAMLQRYKYQHRLHLAEPFADMLIAKLHGRSSPDLIIPMPLHPQRLKERGFNQSLEIARHLATRLQVPLETAAVVRTKLSPPQASLPLKARVKNMKQAFASTRRFDGLRIALVDDVMTTGASLNALAKTIKDAGAEQVECWVIARTLPQQ
jgi:ComF family protein